MGEFHLLDKDNCLKILERFLNTSAFQLKEFEIYSFHNQLQGLVGEHFTLKVEYTQGNEEQLQEFFVKTLSTNPLMMAFSKAIQVYEKEEFFYDFLLKEFEKYKIDTSFAPQGYFFKPYITVLQDLSKEKFKGTPKRQFLDLEHCQISLKTLAKFHGASIIYEKCKGEELGKNFSLLDDFRDILQDKLASKEDNIATRWLMCSIEGLFQLIDLIPENHISHDTFKATLSDMLSADLESVGVVSCVLHGDLWTSNFLYLYDETRPVVSKLIDYQMIKYGPVESDVVEFLMTNTPRDFRFRNFRKLLEFYYRNLNEILTGAGLNCEKILGGCDNFVNSCNNFKLAGKVHAIVDHSFTFVSDEIYGDAMKSEESCRKFLFEERGMYVIESFKKSEEFRNVLREDVLELRDLLFQQDD